MDDTYIIVRVYNKKIVEIYYYDKSNQICSRKNYPVCFKVNLNSLSYIFMLLSLSSIFNSLSTQHKLYLGKEIFKAYVSANLNQVYIQD